MGKRGLLNYKISTDLAPPTMNWVWRECGSLSGLHCYSSYTDMLPSDEMPYREHRMWQFTFICLGSSLCQPILPHSNPNCIMSWLMHGLTILKIKRYLNLILVNAASWLCARACTELSIKPEANAFKYCFCGPGIKVEREDVTLNPVSRGILSQQSVERDKGCSHWNR